MTSAAALPGAFRTICTRNSSGTRLFTLAKPFDFPASVGLRIIGPTDLVYRKVVEAQSPAVDGVVGHVLEPDQHSRLPAYGVRSTESSTHPVDPPVMPGPKLVPFGFSLVVSVVSRMVHVSPPSSDTST